MGYSLDTGPIERYAVRILFILKFCCDRSNQQMSLFVDNESPEDYSECIESETKLQKIDFWVRYPDHLAAALLSECETNPNIGQKKEEIKQVIREIYKNEEPTIRWVPMLKYLRGAYEQLDDVMAFLDSRELASRKIIESGHRTRYFLTHKGSQAVMDILNFCNESKWYSDRCKLIASNFAHLNGFEIREMQYLQGNYADIPPRKMIEQINQEVRIRFENIYGETL